MAKDVKTSELNSSNDISCDKWAIRKEIIHTLTCANQCELQAYDGECFIMSVAFSLFVNKNSPVCDVETESDYCR
jgi:hypothetical protein